MEADRGGPRTRGVPTLTGRQVLLRSPRPSDRQDRLAVGRNAEFVRMVGGDARDLRPFTAKDADSWFHRLFAEPLTWVIEVDGRCIGEARLHHLDRENSRARYAIGIFDPAAWGKGFGTEATRLVLGHAFDVLGLHRVDLRVLDFNRRAIAAYEKCGFVREGVERDGAFIAGEWQTDVIMSILEPEYRRAAPEW